MKIFRIIIMLFVFSAFVTSCITEEPETFEDQGRTVGTILTPFNTNFFFLETSEIAIPIEVSGSVESYNVYQQLVLTNGTTSDVELIASGSSDQTVTIPEAQLFTNSPIAGISSENDLTAGDKWVFTFDVKLQGIETVSTITRTFEVTFSCPVNGFLGTYAVDEDSSYDNVGAGWKGEVTISEVSATSRLLEGTWELVGCCEFGGIGFEFDMLCAEILVSEQSVGLACGDTPVQVITGTTLGTYDPLDDSQFTINVNYNEPGCVGGFESSITLSKVE